MHMLRGLIISLGVISVLSFGSAAAQANLQNGVGGTQQQTQTTQNTQNLQTNSAPLQKNNSSNTLTQNQPKSLGVVANPNQSAPSVIVGESSTTNVPTTVSKGKNYVLILLVAILFLAAIVGFLSYRAASRTPEYEEVVITEPSIVTKPKKSTNPGVKKKKKKAHR